MSIHDLLGLSPDLRNVDNFDDGVGICAANSGALRVNAVDNPPHLHIVAIHDRSKETASAPGHAAGAVRNADTRWLLPAINTNGPPFVLEVVLSGVVAIETQKRTRPGVCIELEHVCPEVDARPDVGRRILLKDTCRRDVLAFLLDDRLAQRPSRRRRYWSNCR